MIFPLSVRTRLLAVAVLFGLSPCFAQQAGGVGRDNEISREKAIEIARQVLRGTAMQLYGLR